MKRDACLHFAPARSKQAKPSQNPAIVNTLRRARDERKFRRRPVPSMVAHVRDKGGLQQKPTVPVGFFRNRDNPSPEAPAARFGLKYNSLTRAGHASVAKLRIVDKRNHNFGFETTTRFTMRNSRIGKRTSK